MSPSRPCGTSAARIAATLTSPAANVEGLHLFTFNQIQQTGQWRRALLAQLAGRGSSAVM